MAKLKKKTSKKSSNKNKITKKCLFKKKDKVNKTAKNLTKTENENLAITEQNCSTTSFESYESAFETSFFYTVDKHINSLDNNEIMQYIVKKYPLFGQQSEDSKIKKTFIQLLRDEQFMKNLLTYFNLTIFDFFKLVYNQYSFLFKTQFLKKLKTEIANKEYARIKRQKSDY